ncbi:hypothetical protein LCGC14_2658320 [marine sediment metagenome]|uniref:Uncharacterized protein n=1 Tax=marine sediment metagenome TaxID=412755 RepID=A0A0F8ZSP0_9ZZZZ
MAISMFNVGDEVRCIKNDGVKYAAGRGAGWANRFTFKILSVSIYEPYTCYFGGVGRNGVYEPYLELVSSSRCEFKAGDKVENIKTDQIDTVRSTPGMPEYDGIGYSGANEGFKLEANGWEFQKDWKLISSFELIKEKTTMNKLTAKIKRIFNPDLQTQYKAELIDDCGDLTEMGRDDLNEILRDKFNSELTEAAQSRIDEEKEDKK